MRRSSAAIDSARSEAGDPGAVGALIALTAAVTACAAVLTAHYGWHQATDRPFVLLAFVAMTIGLLLVSIDVYGHGSYSFAGSGMLAIGFAFGVGPAIASGLLMGAVNTVRRRGRVNRGIYDMSQLALAAGAGTAVFDAFTPAHASMLIRVGPATLAGVVFLATNVSLLSIAMSLSEGSTVRAIWMERFRWMTPYGVASGPLALALVIAYERMGTIGLLAFAAPPAFMMLSVHQYVTKTRTSVEEIRQTNEELQAAVDALEARNADLHDLFEFAGGLAARAHDRATLVGYATDALRHIAGTDVRVSNELDGQVPLIAGGTPVGSLDLGEGVAGERWERLRDTLLPQLATALESTALVEEVSRKHLATIAALSRSMEAKDYYTGGHTERVAQVSVAIAQRLGFEGAELDAIEIGALLHDIGKIGIPEAILHKETELDEDEWAQMHQHPVISDYILSDLDVHPYVRQIARSSHERIDGAGYPDGLKGDEIPLPARIVLVADALDALTTDRPYRRARPLAAALVEMREHTGTQLCPKVMAALERVLREQPQVVGRRLQAVTAVGAA
ncbi:MAG TPA: HD domain-containing phosphohydrolase [Gaiellaceae bacterium]|nr:HD domain-containing phosphohydrolase [Gaiellaceae bacterium]